MNTTYTDTQLKQALAKMLPEKLGYMNTLHYLDKDNFPAKTVLSTELLHICWLVEEGLTIHQYIKYPEILLNRLKDQETNQGYYIDMFLTLHATWQQRTKTLAKMLNIEIL